MNKREIKFRAWNGTKMWYFEPLKGGYQTYPPGPIIRGFNVDGTDGNLFDNPILMQYTGLKDKSGKEIYEGDVVQHCAWDYPFKVIFNNERARFVCEMKTGLTQYIDYKDLEVIGNIYEKPELLK